MSALTRPARGPAQLATALAPTVTDPSGRIGATESGLALFSSVAYEPAYQAAASPAIELGSARPIELIAPIELEIPPSSTGPVSRAVNIAFAVLGLVLSAPVLIAAALLIKLDSSGPVIHRQTRVGIDRRWRSTRALHEARREDLGGRAFTIYKLRTMHEHAERESGAVWATRDDPRVTRVGRFLRKYRMDELPQLWNVILGDMNIVGPRPERPAIVAELRQDIPEYQLRHRVKPGITGLAQINQSYDSSIDDVRSKVAWDLHYIQRQSLWLDIKVMALTIPTVLIKFRGW